MDNPTDFWVGDRFVRPSLGEIQLGPERVHIEPRSMEVLLALARAPSEVIPKKELIEAVWDEAFVSDEVLTHAIWDLRRAFGDNASDPEFIQTIPKRGYRLIAPVRPIERALRRATDRGRAAEQQKPVRRPFSWRMLIWGLAVIALLLWASLRVGGGRQEAGGEVEANPRTTLLLTMGLSDGPRNWGERLEARLGRELAGAELDVFPTDSCAALLDLRADYCLETKLLHGAAGYEAVARLLRGSNGALAFSAAASIQITGENLEGAAAEVGEMMRTFFQVIEDPYVDNPDVKPWISLQDHDVRAIRDFLLGVAYVYRNEIGGRLPLALAMERDPDFIAPRVWRTPSLVDEAEAGTLATHRAELNRLYPDATGFEKAMIRWALALMDGNPAEQIRQLRIALGQVQGNRPIEFVLGATLAGSGDLEGGWRLIQPLVGQNWSYPGLYPLAALMAIQRDEIDDIRQALGLALNVEVVDPEALAVMIVLAIYDEDPESEQVYTRRLELRRRELAPERVDTSSVSGVAESLAARADAEGRRPVADRLRESAD